jgi:hypothetical protein
MATTINNNATGGILPETDTVSAFDSGNLARIGQYQIQKLNILSPLRRSVRPNDVISLDNPDGAAWVELNFFENIERAVVQGMVTIMDAVGIIEGIPILGEEILEVQFSTAGVTPTPTTVANSSDPVPAGSPVVINRFRIYKADPPIQVSDTLREVTLHFVSDLAVKNTQTQVQKSFKGNADIPLTISDIARNIYIESFTSLDKTNLDGQPTNKEFLVEPTSGMYSVHVPNWTPFKAIRFLTERAQSSNVNSKGAHFVFYETLKGYRFVSVETLMQGGFKNYQQLVEPTDESKKVFPQLPTHRDKSSNQSFIPYFKKEIIQPDPQKPTHVATYVYQPGNIAGQNEYQKRFAVQEFEVLKSVDTFDSLGSGMYANRVITHNLIDMSIHSANYFYKPQQDNMIVEDNGVPTTKKNTNKLDGDTEVSVDNFITAEGGALCSDHADFLNRPESHVSLYPTNRGESSKFAGGAVKDIIPSLDGTIKAGYGMTHKTPAGTEPIGIAEEERNIEEVLGKRISQKLQMKSIVISFTVPGDSSREVGDLIYFSYPTDRSEVRDTGMMEEHKYYSGRYLITAIRHKITHNEYTMIIEASKDSYLSAPSAGFGAEPPELQRPDGSVTGSSAIGVGGTLQTNPNTGKLVGGL